MRILINTANILEDVDGVFLMETAAHDGMPPKGVLTQYLNEAHTRVLMILGRHYVPMAMVEADDSLALGDVLCYELNLTSRKAAGKTQSFADAIHSFMVNAILTKVYSNSGRLELSQKHEAQSVADAQGINTLLHTKRHPYA